MQITVVEEGGFCFGVRRALELAHQAIQQHRQVFSLGPLIHNRQVVDQLAAAGLQAIEDLSELPEGAVVIIRAHGAGPATYQQAQTRGIPLIDATCPFVARVQQEAAQFAEEGYQVLVLGETDHPEPRAIVEYTHGQAIIVEGPEGLGDLELGSKVAVVCQTTQHPENLQALVAALLPQVKEIRVANTICAATTTRQQASVALARQVDLMVVVGGYHSANTRRLTQVCQATGTATYHIETAEEIDPEWLRGVGRAGVTAGASTPPEVVEAVVKRLSELADHCEEGES